MRQAAVFKIVGNPYLSLALIPVNRGQENNRFVSRVVLVVNFNIVPAPLIAVTVGRSAVLDRRKDGKTIAPPHHQSCCWFSVY